MTEKDNLSDNHTNSNSLTNNDTTAVKSSNATHAALESSNDVPVAVSTPVDTNEVTIPANSINTETPVNVSTQNEFAPESVTMTRKEYKQQTKKLPQTGDKSSLAMILLGTVATMFGVGLATKKKEY